MYIVVGTSGKLGKENLVTKHYFVSFYVLDGNRDSVG